MQARKLNTTRHKSTGGGRTGLARALALVALACGAAACRTRPPALPVHVTPITKPDKPVAAAANDRETTETAALKAGDLRPVNPQTLGEGARLLVGREFEPIFFDGSGTELAAEARRRLTEYVDWLGKPEHGHVWVALVGYCDAGQGVRFGYGLAMARALAVEEFLAGNGLDRRRIYSIGYGRGDEKPTSNRVEVLGFVGPQNEDDLGKVPTEPEAAPEPEPQPEFPKDE